MGSFGTPYLKTDWPCLVQLIGVRLTCHILWDIAQGLGVHFTNYIGDTENISIKSLLSAGLMKHFLKIMSLLVTISGFWIGLLQSSVVPQSYTWLLPVYSIVSLGCYGLFMVGLGLMQFPTCPQESRLLQKDIVQAKEFLKQRGVDVGSD